MKKEHFVHIIFMFLAAVAALFSSASAQVIDVSNMSSEELSSLILLLQQFQQDNPGVSAEPTPTPTPVSAAGYSEEELMQLLLLLRQLQQNQENGAEGTISPGDDSEKGQTVKSFHVYENKKLIMERIPDDRFIQKDTGQDDMEKKDSGDPDKKKDDHSCEPGCSYECRELSGYYVCACFCSDG